MADGIQALAGRTRYSGISLLFCSLAFIAPLIIPRMFFDFSVVTKEAVLQVGIMIIMWVWSFVMIKKGGRVKFPAVFPFIVIFLAYISVTSLWAVNPYEGFSIALHWSICSLAILIVANAVNKDHLFLTIFASGVLVAIIGLLQQYAGFDYFQQAVPPASTFANKNFAVHYAAVCLPLGFIFSREKRILIAFGSALILAYILICRTDVAILAILAMGIFICIRNPKFIIGIVFVAISWAIIMSPDGLEKRFSIWENTAEIAVDNPFGVGLGNFKIVYPAYDSEITTRNVVEFSHNEPAQIWAETGYTGIILFFMAFAGVMMNIDFKKRVGIAAIIGICVISAFSFPLRLPMLPFTGACVLGALSK